MLAEPMSSLYAKGNTTVSEAVLSCHGVVPNKYKHKFQYGKGLLLITHCALSLKVVEDIIMLKRGRVGKRGTC